MRNLSAIASVFALTGCVAGSPQGGQSASVQQEATTRLVDAGGRQIGDARFDQAGPARAVRIRVNTAGLRPGTYAAHVHAVGRCDAPDFTSAGGHWNPRGRQHGRENPAGAHVGDLPNIVVGANGRGSIDARMNAASLRGGANPLFDVDGSALLIHAAADDYRTDPSGNSGARIACGVIG